MDFTEGNILLNLVKFIGLVRFYDAGLNLLQNAVVIFNHLSQLIL